MKKTDGRNLSLATLAYVRQQAVKLHQQRKKNIEIAAILSIHRNTVGEWIKTYKTQGMKGLKLQTPGRKTGSGRRLTAEQEKQIQKMIRDKMPDQLKLPFALWNRRAIQALIQDQFDIDMPVRTINHYLKRWGFSAQRPIKRAYEQNPKKVREWLDTTYPSIAERAKRETAEIHWGDETGISSDCHYGRSYAPKGQTPVVRRNANRFSTNMISSITNQGKVRFMCYQGAMNSDTFLKFLKRLVKDSPKKIFLVVDNLRVHHSKPVTEWLERNSDKIELFFLPSYSPERNPDEYLNRDLKQSISAKPPARNGNQLNKQLRSHMRNIQKMPDRVKTYFKNPYVSYAR